MYKQGHFGLGLLSTSLFALTIAELGYLTWVPLIALAGIAGGMLPDIDNKPLIPFKHHGWTHTVVFGFLASGIITGLLLAGFYSTQQILSATPLALPAVSIFEYILLSAILYLSSLFGIFSHLFGDALSTAGGTLLIKPWRPVSENYVRFGVATAGDPYLNTGFFVVGAVSHGAIYYVYLL